MRRTIAAVATLLAGCTSVTGLDDGLHVRTAAEAYAVGAPIVARVVNRTGETVHVAHCNFRVSMLIERRIVDTWEHYRQSNGPLCLTIHPMGELVIEPGDELPDTLRIEDAGEFRLRLHARFAHEDFGSTVVISRPFTVRYPPD